MVLLAALQEESEVTDGGVSCQKLSVKGGVLVFCGGKLLGIKGQLEASTALDTGGTGFRASKDGNGG